MNKKSKNKFDSLVEDLIQRFSNIKNFELLSDSEETKKLWNYLVNTIVDLNSLKNLFIGIYIPQANKFIYESKQDFRKSKYSPFLKMDDSLWKAEINQLVRIGYVTLFHKYENFVGALFPLIGENYIQFEDKTINLKQYAQKKFDLKIDKEWYLNSFLKKLNWICNSQKHNDGFPQVNHPYYKEDSINKILYPEQKRIELLPDTLKNDIELMIQFSIMIYQLIMQIALYRMSVEICNKSESMDESFVIEQNRKFDEVEMKIESQIDLIRSI